MTLNVLITGANSGFGLLAAKTFAAAGHTVHAGYRNPGKIGSLTALADQGLAVVPVLLDVTDQASVDAAVATASAASPINVLVNNAGFEVMGPIEQISDESYYRQFDTNVLGVIRMVRAVAPQLRKQRSGAIINLSSVVGVITAPYTGLYAASKHAVEALSEALALELRPFGVHVALVEPGAFATEFGANVVHEPAFTEESAYFPHAQRFRTAMGRFVQASQAAQNPQEVADAIVAAATGPDKKLRHLVGADAHMVVGAYRAAPDFETFTTTMLGQLGVADLLA